MGDFETDMKIKKLMPMDAESRRLIDWMEKGFLYIMIDFSAFQRLHSTASSFLFDDLFPHHGI